MAGHTIKFSLFITTTHFEATRGHFRDEPCRFIALSDKEVHSLVPSQCRIVPSWIRNQISVKIEGELLLGIRQIYQDQTSSRFVSWSFRAGRYQFMCRPYLLTTV
ncbi:hypothetical protein AVEN_227930-1 [Araneus ventricosus]|uniref:Uncharacterized protein n=1 Tax=Araneus ventricosus TaxID=182803 RepID=A0A4Y2MNS9_ARAVE|nr:hypothetical protein AVEN_4375-1 [Araneus ventricosus]GBN31152.1 hypothetical protein AVEN_236679-1 [Araneus ventricosus]GBN31161.1 hypothetical protein AVEN_227930-1 [Araneus ventricosus]